MCRPTWSTLKTLFFKRYIIKKVNDKNVGIFGVIGDTSEMVSKVSEITKDAVSIQDPLQAAESVVKELTGKVDYIVALTHQGINRDWVIARRVQGIDLVVGGHDKQKTKEPFGGEESYFPGGRKGSIPGPSGSRYGRDQNGKEYAGSFQCRYCQRS